MTTNDMHLYEHSVLKMNINVEKLLLVFLKVLFNRTAKQTSLLDFTFSFKNKSSQNYPTAPDLAILLLFLKNNNNTVTTPRARRRYRFLCIKQIAQTRKRQRTLEREMY